MRRFSVLENAGDAFSAKGGEYIMCYNCGCGIADDDMGHPDNITTETFKEVAAKTGKDIKTVKSEISVWLKSEVEGNHTENAVYDEVFEKASAAWGQSVDNAKKEAYKMLSKEV